MLTEKEIITLLKHNERGFMFLPKEVQDWANEHRRDFLKICANGSLIAKSPGNYFDFGSIYQLRKDYPEPTPLPELEEGLYCLIEKDGAGWSMGLYHSLDDGWYCFYTQNSKNGTFTIDPAKWHIRRIVMEA